MRVRLFSQGRRASDAVRGFTESAYEFLDASSWPESEAIRRELQAWLDRYPTSAAPDLVRRFQCTDDLDHYGAFYELYLHELLTRTGFQLTPHPTLDGISTTPDFEVTRNGRRAFYLEATVAGARQDSGEESRRNRLLHLVSQVRSNQYMLRAIVEVVPRSDPPAAAITKRISQWLEGLDQARDFAYFSSHDGPSLELGRPDWLLRVTAVRFQRDGEEPQPSLGVWSRGGRHLDTDSAIRDAVKKKATKYGSLDAPFIVAVNCVDWMADDTSVASAIFGRPRFWVSPMTYEASVESGIGGAWFHKEPQNTRVSGLVVNYALGPYDVHRQPPELWVNPWAASPLADGIWPFTRVEPDATGARMHPVEVPSPPDPFLLPAKWPYVSPSRFAWWRTVRLAKRVLGSLR